MSKKNPERDEKVWEMTDKFINLANEECNNNKNGQVSTSIMFSAARFNAFMFASNTADLAEFMKDKEMAIKYFTTQYEQALKENLNDYEKNYKDYVGKK